MDSKTIDKAMREKLCVYHKGRRYEQILEYVMFYDYSGKRRLRRVWRGLVLDQGRGAAGAGGGRWLNRERFTWAFPAPTAPHTTDARCASATSDGWRCMWIG